MNIIVTNNKIDYEGFIKVKSLKEVSTDIVGSINYLVYHKSNESRESKVESLTKLKDSVDTLVYIRSKESVEQAVQMIVVGSGGKYLDDEFFLESSEELNKLVKNLKEVTEIAELGGVNVLSDFFNRYLKNGSADFNTNYLTVVKSAVLSLIDDYKQKDLELLQLSETATEIFTNSADLVSKIQSEQEKLKTVVETLESSKSKGGYISSGNVPNILFFPQITYPKEKNIVRIKDVGGCCFLTSLLLGFRAYLEKIKYVRPKLVFIEPVGIQYEKKYGDFAWVTQQTYKDMGSYYNPVVFTSYPNKEVITRLLEDSDYDTFIIVDRLRSSKDHILNSKGGSIRYAISSSSILQKFRLKPADCFSSISEVRGSLFTVPMFTEYPSTSDQRERLYFRTCDKFYEVLYNVRRK